MLEILKAHVPFNTRVWYWTTLLFFVPIGAFGRIALLPVGDSLFHSLIVMVKSWWENGAELLSLLLLVAIGIVSVALNVATALLGSWLVLSFAGAARLFRSHKSGRNEPAPGVAAWMREHRKPCSFVLAMGFVTTVAIFFLAHGTMFSLCVPAPGFLLLIALPLCYLAVTKIWTLVYGGVGITYVERLVLYSCLMAGVAILVLLGFLS